MKVLGRLFHLDYVGKVEAVSYDGDFPVDRTISVGDSITGKIIYDLDTKDTYSKPGFDKSQYPRTALYEMNPKDKYYGFTAIINGHKFLTNPDRVVVSYDETENNFGDRIFIKGSMVENPEYRGLEPSLPFGLNGGNIKWELRDESMAAISSQELPTKINLNDWKVNEIQVVGVNVKNMETIYSLRVTGTVETVTHAEQDETPPAPPSGLRIN